MFVPTMLLHGLEPKWSIWGSKLSSQDFTSEKKIYVRKMDSELAQLKTTKWKSVAWSHKLCKHHALHWLSEHQSVNIRFLNQGSIFL